MHTSYVSSENYCNTAKRTQIWHFSCFTFNQRHVRHGPERKWFRFLRRSRFLCGYWIIFYRHSVKWDFAIFTRWQRLRPLIAASYNASLLLLLCFQFLMILVWSLCRSWLSFRRVSQILSSTWHVCYLKTSKPDIQVAVVAGVAVVVRDLWTADASVRGSRSAGFFADSDRRGSCSVTKFADADWRGSCFVTSVFFPNKI